MTPTQLILVLIFMALGIIASALFSGIETGSYCINRVRLRIKSQANQPHAKTLESLLQKKQAFLATLLIGNNIANYIGTAMLSIILEQHFKLTLVQIILINVALITPLLFVFGETLPKNIFATHADKLLYPLAKMILIAKFIFTYTGLLPIILKTSNITLKLIGSPQTQPLSPHPGRRVSLLLKEGLSLGLLTDTQTDLIQRVITYKNRKVEDEMTPWEDTVTLNQTDAVEALYQLANTSPYTRFPVINSSGQPVGMVDIFDAILHTPAACPGIEQLKTKLHSFAPDTPARDALQKMQRDSIALALIQNPNQPPRGIITIKDLVEPITGDLVNW